jgi:hypothetical protein
MIDRRKFGERSTLMTTQNVLDRKVPTPDRSAPRRSPRRVVDCWIEPTPFPRVVRTRPVIVAVTRVESDSAALAWEVQLRGRTRTFELNARADTLSGAFEKLAEILASLAIGVSTLDVAGLS